MSNQQRRLRRAAQHPRERRRLETRSRRYDHRREPSAGYDVERDVIVDPMVSALWLYMAVRGGFKWFERVSSASNLADKPSRGLVPDCPCGWRLQEMSGVLRWSPEDHAALERP